MIDIIHRAILQNEVPHPASFAFRKKRGTSQQVIISANSMEIINKTLEENKSNAYQPLH